MLTVIRGTGEIGSAATLALFRNGHRVVLHDGSRPSHTRRGVAFTDALFRGRATIVSMNSRRSASTVMPDVRVLAMSSSDSEEDHCWRNASRRGCIGQAIR